MIFKAFALILAVILTQTTKPTFEVASIKPSLSERPMIADPPGGRFVARGVSLRLLMGFAYRGVNVQYSGTPDWMESDRWDIEAKAPEGLVRPRTGPPDITKPDTMALLVQSLIEDRFQLRMHSEVKEMPVYELRVAKGGLKMKLSDDQTPVQWPAPGTAAPQRGAPLPRGLMRMGRGSIDVSAIPFSGFVQMLSPLVGRTVIDRTGLEGLYDVKLEWTPDEFAAGVGPFASGGIRPAEPPPPPDASSLSIFTALEGQLGLKVEPAKAPLEVTIIDSVQKPKPN